MKGLKWILIGLAVMAVLILAFYGEEDWRGKYAWEQYKRQVEATGESLNWSDYVPPAVPDEQNFFKAPKMQDWFQESFGSGSANNELSGLQTNDAYPESITNKIKATDYLAWSDQFNPQFDLIHEALKRPSVRMDGKYFPPYLQPMPNFIAFRRVSIVLASRAKSHLLLGQPEKALDELTFLNNFRHILDLPPAGKPMSVVVTLINTADASLYADTITDGLKLHAWKEQQLEPLQEQLRQINLMALLLNATRTQSAQSCYFVTNYIAGITGTKSRLTDGWLFQNLVTIIKLDRQAIESVNVGNNTVSPGRLDKWEREADIISKHYYLPDDTFVSFDILDFAKAWRTTAYNQTLINETEIACALERYRLAHGEYPETLNGLMPQFIDAIPHDIIGGQPLHYRRTPDGKFLLYSVGWNEIDDGGEDSPHNQYGGITDYTRGDWVWTGTGK